MVSASPATRPPVTGVVRSSFDLLEIVDALPDGATGELVLRNSGAAIIGVIFVEARRVCWVAARGWAGRLSDLLRARTNPPLDASAMEEIYRRCQREGSRLGEHLVSRKLLAPSDLREALLRHSVECLQSLGESRVSVRFSPRAAGGYAPDFTFSTSDMATALGSLAHGESAQEHVSELTACQPTWGALFARHPAHAQPLPLAEIGESSSARRLLGVGAWAVNVLDIAGALDGPPRMTAFADQGKGGTILWSANGVVSVACFVDQSPFVRALSRRASRSA